MTELEVNVFLLNDGGGSIYATCDHLSGKQDRRGTSGKELGPAHLPLRVTLVPCAITTFLTSQRSTKLCELTKEASMQLFTMDRRMMLGDPDNYRPCSRFLSTIQT
jgi:hypothetical protein